MFSPIDIPQEKGDGRRHTQVTSRTPEHTHEHIPRDVICFHIIKAKNQKQILTHPYPNTYIKRANKAGPGINTSQRSHPALLV